MTFCGNMRCVKPNSTHHVSMEQVSREIVMLYLCCSMLQNGATGGMLTEALLKEEEEEKSSPSCRRAGADQGNNGHIICLRLLER